MKKLLILLISIVSLTLFNCKKDFEDYNKVPEEIAYKTPDAYPGIILGMTKDFTKNTLYRIIHGPGLTATELGGMNTYLTEPQLENGGPALPPDNSSLSELFYDLHANRNIAEKVLKYIDNLNFANDNEKLGIKSYAKFFKALTTGYMSQYWEKVTLENNENNEAVYVGRIQGLETAVSLLDETINDLDGQTDAIDYINNLVSNNFSIIDVLHAFKARYEIELGNYQEAYNEANAVDLTKMSVWTYDGGTHKNPLYSHTIYPNATLTIRPIDSLGLTGTQTPEPNDQRIPFYLTYTSTVSEHGCQFAVDDPKGFWETETSPIPVYLPGEMILIKAEAKARMGGNANLAEAVTFINQVRTKTAPEDIFGVGADLSDWTGDATNQQDVLDEIYKNYAIELFLQGQRWPIHRRFYPNYLDNIDFNNTSGCSLERSNNFYPYPDREHSNNPNCPPNPAY